MSSNSDPIDPSFKFFTSIMAYLWVLLVDVLGNALLWFRWLYSFSLQSTDKWFSLCVGAVTLVLSTGIVWMLLVFGEQEHFDGRPASFWMGICCTIYTC